MFSCLCLAFALSGHSHAAASCTAYINTDSTATDSLAEEEKVYVFEKTDNIPTLLGGDLLKLLNSEIKYPESAWKNKKEGRVFLRFVVKKDGSVTNPTVVMGDSVLAQEAVRAFNAVNQKYRWEPAKVKGKPVNFQMSIPISFRLNKIQPKK